MRLLSHIGFGFVTLVCISAAWAAIAGTTRVGPVPLVVSAMYLGLTSRGHLASAVAAAIALGYIADVLAGTPGGLFALCAALAAISGHIAQGRFVLRGTLLSAGVCAAAAALFVLIASLISGAVGIEAGARQSPVVLAWCAVLTAIVGPLQLSLHRRIDARLARTQRERDASLEGVASA